VQFILLLLLSVKPFRFYLLIRAAVERCLLAEALIPGTFRGERHRLPNRKVGKEGASKFQFLKQSVEAFDLIGWYGLKYPLFASGPFKQALAQLLQRKADRLWFRSQSPALGDHRDLGQAPSRQFNAALAG
jgi:hypothetical protein